MKKVVIGFLVGVVVSSAVFADDVLLNPVPSSASKTGTANEGGGAGGFFSVLGNALNPKNETVKVEGLIGANLHTSCPDHKEKVGEQLLSIPCPGNSKMKEGDRWLYNNEVFTNRGRPTRTGTYTAYREDSDDYERGYDRDFVKNDKVLERHVYYYDSKGKTEVFVFGHCYKDRCALLDDFITSTPDFVLKHDRAM